MKFRVTVVERVVVINLESSNFLNYSGFHWVPPLALSQLEIKTGNLPQTFSTINLCQETLTNQSRNVGKIREDWEALEFYFVSLGSSGR